MINTRTTIKNMPKETTILPPTDYNPTQNSLHSSPSSLSRTIDIQKASTSQILFESQHINKSSIIQDSNNPIENKVNDVMKQKDAEIILLNGQMNLLSSSKERMEHTLEESIRSRDEIISSLESQIGSQKMYIELLEEKVMGTKKLSTPGDDDEEEKRLERSEHLTAEESSSENLVRKEDDAVLRSERELKRNRCLGSIRNMIDRDEALLADIQDLVKEDVVVSSDRDESKSRGYLGTLETIEE